MRMTFAMKCLTGLAVLSVSQMALAATPAQKAKWEEMRAKQQAHIADVKARNAALKAKVATEKPKWQAMRQKEQAIHKEDMAKKAAAQ